MKKPAVRRCCEFHDHAPIAPLSAGRAFGLLVQRLPARLEGGSGLSSLSADGIFENGEKP